jgi:hypothetical protein
LDLEKALDSTGGLNLESETKKIEEKEEIVAENCVNEKQSVCRTGDDAKEDASSTRAEVETVYCPDGGLRAWLVVLGCFMYACSCMCVRQVYV